MKATDNAELPNGLNSSSKQNTALFHMNHRRLNLSGRIYYILLNTFGFLQRFPLFGDGAGLQTLSSSNCNFIHSVMLVDWGSH